MAQPNRNQSSNGTEAVHTPADTSQPLNISQYSRQVAVPSHAFQPWNMQWNWFWPSPNYIYHPIPNFFTATHPYQTGGHARIEDVNDVNQNDFTSSSPLLIDWHPTMHQSPSYNNHEDPLSSSFSTSSLLTVGSTAYSPVTSPQNSSNLFSDHNRGVGPLNTSNFLEISATGNSTHRMIEHNSHNEVSANNVNLDTSNLSVTNHSDTDVTRPLQNEAEGAEDLIKPHQDTELLQNSDIDAVNLSVLDEILKDDEWKSAASNRILQSLFSPHCTADTDIAQGSLNNGTTALPAQPSFLAGSSSQVPQSDKVQPSSAVNPPITAPNPPFSDIAETNVPQTPPNRSQQILATPSSANANRLTVAHDVMWALQPATVKRKRTEDRGYSTNLVSPSHKKTKTEYIPPTPHAALHEHSTSSSLAPSFPVLAQNPSADVAEPNVPSALTMMQSPGIAHPSDISIDKTAMPLYLDIFPNSHTILDDTARTVPSDTHRVSSGPTNLPSPLIVSPANLSTATLSPNRGQPRGNGVLMNSLEDRVPSLREQYVDDTIVVPEDDTYTSQRTIGRETPLLLEDITYRSADILSNQPGRSPMATSGVSSSDPHGSNEVKRRTPLFLPSRSPSPIQENAPPDKPLPLANAISSILSGSVQSMPLNNDMTLVPSKSRPYVLIPQLRNLLINTKKTTPLYLQGRGKRTVEPELREVEESRSRLTTRRCLWRDCSAVLDSGEKLLKHTKVVHGSVAYGEVYRCKWADCPRLGTYFRSEELIRHLKSHVYQLITCPYKGCAYETNQGDRLVRHIEKEHDDRRDILKPTALPNLSLSKAVVEPVETCPSYYSIPIPVVATPISKERHQKLEPLIRAHIVGRYKPPKHRDSSSVASSDTDYNFQQDETASKAFVSLRQMSPVIDEVDILEGSLVDNMIISIDGNHMPDLAADGRVGVSPQDVDEGLDTDFGPNLLQIVPEEHESLEVDNSL